MRAAARTLSPNRFRSLPAGSFATGPRRNSWIIASALATAVAAILRTVKFNDLAQRAGISGFVQKMGVHTDAAGFLATLVKWFVRLIVLVTAFDALGLPAVSQVLQQILLWLPNLVVALVVLVKYIQRQRFYRQLRMARVTANELWAMLESAAPPVVLDVRAESARKHDPRRIPRAITASTSDIAERLADYPPPHNIVLYCT